jgi:hypothetical protein
MKKIAFLLFVLLIGQLIAQNVNGELVIENDRKILKVWGTHYERGYAQGFLLGYYLQDIMKNYILSTVYVNNAASYNTIRTYFNANFIVDAPYVTEAEALINGMIDSGTDIFSTLLGRNFDAIDILMASSITDISALGLFEHLQLGCSSMSSWSSATQNDSELNGNLIITRQMDWSSHPKLIQNHLLLIHFPAEENEVPWVSFTFPGFLGALSGINQNGLAAFKNVGNNHSHPNSGGVHPILLSLRNAIESVDYNADSMVSVEDVINAVQDKNRLAGSLIHAVTSENAVVIECNNANGVAVRTLEQNNVNPPITGNNLVVTNHFRMLYNPVNCFRYTRFSDSLAVNSEISPTRSRQITNGAGGVPTNLHTIQYVPAWQEVSWAVATTGIPAYQNAYVTYHLQDLFSQVSTLSDETSNYFSIFLAPNPIREIAVINFEAKKTGVYEFSIFNIKGQKIYTTIQDISVIGHHQMIWNGKDKQNRNTVAGIYFYQLKHGQNIQTGKALKL